MAHTPKFTMTPKGPQVEPLNCQSEHDCCHQTVEMRVHTPYRWTQKTMTTGIDIPPQPAADMFALIAATAAAFEGAGYRIEGHSLVQAGPASGGWKFFVTLGWDECVPCEPMPGTPQGARK